MLIKRVDMMKKIRKELKGGKGDIKFLDHFEKDLVPNCRLFSEMTIPIGGSIGEHTHINETEIYLIREGIAAVTDNEKNVIAEVGDVVVTGDNQTHSIENIGKVPLVITAIIVTQ